MCVCVWCACVCDGHVCVMCMCVWCAWVCGVHECVVCMCVWCACVCDVHECVVCVCVWSVCVCDVHVCVMGMCVMCMCVWCVVCMCVWCACVCLCGSQWTYNHIWSCWASTTELVCPCGALQICMYAGAHNRWHTHLKLAPSDEDSGIIQHIGEVYTIP